MGFVRAAGRPAVDRIPCRIAFMALLALMFALAPAPDKPGSASPWAEVGDAALRRDIEILAANRLVDPLISTWPLPWGPIARRLSEVPNGLPRHVGRAVERVRSRLRQETQSGTVRARAALRLANKSALIRDFAATGRDRVDARVDTEYLANSTALRLRLGLLSDADLGDPDLILDDSYIAQGLGGWLAYAGMVEHWWGPGNITSVALSNNAKPFPKLGLMRYDPESFETPWLSWIGPWQINAFTGVLSDNGRAVRNPVVVGLRGAINPLPGLELGASRLMQLCGSGRSCGFRTFFDALVGNNENTPDKDPGNQQGGFDARLMLNAFGVGWSIYGQIVGEDEANGLPFKSAGVAGLSLTGGLPNEKGGLWAVTAEFSDSASGFQKTDPDFNVFCNHGDFGSGLRYHDRCLGPGLDNDSRLFSIVAAVMDRRDRTWRLTYHHAKLNRDGEAGGNTVSRSDESINVLELALRVPVRRHIFGIELRLQDDRPNTPGARDFETAVEAGWSTRF